MVKQKNYGLKAMNPKVSVIIPVYNTSKYLRRSLDSVVNQTLKEIEIIIINDGSTDNFLDIIREYANKDSRIGVINQKNKGQAAARNKGLDIAKGEYISFVDSDDFLDLHFLKKICDLMVNKNALIGVANQVRFFDSSNSYILNPIDFKNITNFAELLHGTLKHQIPGAVCNKIFNKNFIKNVRFPSGFYEDSMFLVEILCNNPLNSITVFVDVDYYYVYNNKSTTNTLNHQKIDDLIMNQLIGVKNILSTSGLLESYKIPFELFQLFIITSLFRANGLNFATNQYSRNLYYYFKNQINNSECDFKFNFNSIFLILQSNLNWLRKIKLIIRSILIFSETYIGHYILLLIINRKH